MSAPVAARTTTASPGRFSAIVAVTGIRDDVNDIITPGAFRRTLRERTPRGVVGHDWNRPVAVCEKAIELMPGDPRLPRRTADGRPWPREAGALVVDGRWIDTPEGRDAAAIARAYGTTGTGAQAYSIGYRVPADGARVRNGVRHITDLELYEFSPVLHGANRLATLTAIREGKSAAGVPALEHKVTAAGLPQLTAVRCSVCRQPAHAGNYTSPARAGVLCAACVTALDDRVDALADTVEDDTTIPAGALAAAGVGGDTIDPDDLADALGDDDQDDDEPDDDGPDLVELDDRAAVDPARALFTRVLCSICGLSAGGVVPGQTADDDVVCAVCLADLQERVEQLSRATLDNPGRDLTTAEEYDDARRGEVEWDLTADGTLVRRRDDGWTAPGSHRP